MSDAETPTLETELAAARQRYLAARGTLRDLVEETVQIEEASVKVAGVFLNEVLTTSAKRSPEEHQRLLVAARHEVDMSRADYDDLFFRAMREHEEKNRREAARTQRILMGATVVYSILTLLMAVAVGIQAWAAWKQTRQVVQPPIVNITVLK